MSGETGCADWEKDRADQKEVGAVQLGEVRQGTTRS